MPILLLHTNAVFEDETLYLSGNAYTGCTFRRCMFIVGDIPFSMSGCGFDTCVWRLEMTVHDLHSLAKVDDLIPIMRPTLPRMGDEEES